MFIMDDVTGDMTVRQGDSFSFTITGITDEWDVYFSVYKGTNREILFETSAKPVNEETVFNITPAESTKLTVPVGKKTELYYYGIKRCKDGVEDTVIIGDKEIGALNKVTVYPLITEGAENGAS